MAHYVICQVCKQRFDRDKLPAVQISPRRYAHKECADGGEPPQPPQKQQEDIDKEQLDAYIMKLLKQDFINAKVKKQIKDFKAQYNYSYSGMLKSLVYFYEVKGNSVEKANGGVGIIPFVYQDAFNYYYNLWKIRQSNEDKKFSSFKDAQIKEIIIQSPQVERKAIKLFNLDDDEED